MTRPFFRHAIGTCAAVILLIVSPRLMGMPPDWAVHLHSALNPTELGAAAAAVLLDETVIDIDAQGVTTTTHRVAIRILAEQGRGSRPRSLFAEYRQSSKSERLAHPQRS